MLTKNSFGLGNALVSALHNSKKPSVQFYENKEAQPSQRWRWTLWFSSDKVAASTEGYSSLAEAKENFLKIEKHIEYLRTNGKVG